MNSWRILRDNLGRPEYVHVLINPLPVYGLAVSIIALIIALFTRKQPAIATALCLVTLSGLTAWPTYIYGEAAYDRVYAISDTAGSQWLEQHQARARKWIEVFYILAGFALVALIVQARWPATSLPLAGATLLLAVATLCIGGWIAYPGGRIRHSEFRFEQPRSRTTGDQK